MAYTGLQMTNAGGGGGRLYLWHKCQYQLDGKFKS